MAEDKQLTVAELLARNKQERANGDQPRRRRRHRSLEDGGVSVAELTGSMKKVEATPAQSKHSNVDIDETAPVIPAPKPEAESAPAAQAEAERIEALKRAEFAKKAEEAKKKAAERKAAEHKAAAQNTAEPVTTESAPLDDKAEEDRRILADKREREAAQAEHVDSPSMDDTAVIQKVEAEPQATTQATGATAVKASQFDNSVADTGELEAVETTADHDEAEDDGKLNAVSVVLLALVGIVLGAVVFKGFEILWTNFSNIVVAVLAVAVTAAMAGVVHALRTDRDKISIILAIIVGLVLTFGALLTS